MKKRWNILLLILFILFSCNRRDTTMAILLEHESVEIENLMIGFAGGVKQVDSFLVILDYKNNAFFHLVNTERMQYDGSFGLKGDGPLDFLHPSDIIRYTSHSLCCYDLMKRTVSELKFYNDSIFFNTIMKCDTLMNFNVLPVKNNNFIGVGLYQDSMFKIINRKGRITKGYFSYPYKDETEAKIHANVRGMAYQGPMDINPSQNKLVYATSYAKQLYFFSVEEDKMRLIKEIKESYPQYIPDTSQGVSIVYDKKAPFGFTDVVTTDKFVYALYSGKSFEEYGLQDSEGDNLLVYNWQGELIRTYKLDVDVSCICVDDRDKIMYAITNNPDPLIVKFVIEK